MRSVLTYVTLREFTIPINGSSGIPHQVLNILLHDVKFLLFLIIYI